MKARSLGIHPYTQLPRRTRHPAPTINHTAPQWLGPAPVDPHPQPPTCSSGLKMHLVVAYAQGKLPHTCTGLLNLRVGGRDVRSGICERVEAGPWQYKPMPLFAASSTAAPHDTCAGP